MIKRVADRVANISKSYHNLLSFQYNYRINLESRLRTAILPVQKVTDFSLTSYKNDKPNTVSIYNVKAPVLKVPSTKECQNLNTLDGFNQDADYMKLSDSHLDDLLEAIKLRRLDPFESDFVSMRFAFRTIMLTPFRQRTRWRIGASKFKNTIFMRCYDENNYALRDSDEENEMAYRYVNIKRLTTEPEEELLDKDAIYKAYFSVFQTHLRRENQGMFKLLYAGELDAIIDEKKDDTDPENFTNIRMTPSNKPEHKQRTYFLRKYPQWWTISTLSGIDKITVANRDKDWKIENYSEIHVPSMPLECEQYFKDNKMLDVASFNYLYDFLQHVKKIMANEDDPKSLYLFDYNFSTGPGVRLPSTGWRVKTSSLSPNSLADSGPIMQGIRPKVQCKKILKDLPKWRILPDWFIDELETPNYNYNVKENPVENECKQRGLPIS